MTVVKINAITVPADSGDELAQRFAKRAGAVDGADGFEGFELLKPTDERTTWLVVTRWREIELLADEAGPFIYPLSRTGRLQPIDLDKAIAAAARRRIIR
jgi:hypothetical protein